MESFCPFPFILRTVEKEGIMRCSKWLRHAALLSLKEMEIFLDSLGSFYFIPAAGLVSLGNWQITKEEFLLQYRSYVEWLNLHSELPSPSFRKFFTLMLSSSLEDFYAVPTSSDRFVIKARRPVIQIQLYHCFISRFDGQIHPMALSQESFSWGIQISYPQIYEDPVTHQFSKVMLSKDFMNTEVFKEMVQWFRKNTKPVSLEIQEQKIYAPFRIGKESTELVSSHLGLQKALGEK